MTSRLGLGAEHSAAWSAPYTRASIIHRNEHRARVHDRAPRHDLLEGDPVAIAARAVRGLGGDARRRRRSHTPRAAPSRAAARHSPPSSSTSSGCSSRCAARFLADYTFPCCRWFPSPRGRGSNFMLGLLAAAATVVAVLLAADAIVVRRSAQRHCAPALPFRSRAGWLDRGAVQPVRRRRRGRGRIRSSAPSIASGNHGGTRTAPLQ